jgi:hypothetical protein
MRASGPKATTASFFNVTVVLPAVGGMDLLGIDYEELLPVPEPLVDVFHAPHLGAEWGSR